MRHLLELIGQVLADELTVGIANSGSLSSEPPALE